jgi:cell filamentation protein
MLDQIDPYVYPNTHVLINKLNIRDPIQLERVELDLFAANFFKPSPKGNFDYDHLKKLHHHLFKDLYSWAGEERTVSISKGDTLFAIPHRIAHCVNHLFSSLLRDNHLKNLSIQLFTQKAAHYFNEINAVHPFREGNGRTLRLFFSELGNHAGYLIDWKAVDANLYLKASIQGFHQNDALMIEIFQKITRANFILSV